MEIEKVEEHRACFIKVIAKDNGNIVGRAYLYLIYNDLHNSPYGLLEDLFVSETYRSKGIGRALLETVIAEAKARDCYKLIGTSRTNREEIHAWYERAGFKKYGIEFRMEIC